MTLRALCDTVNIVEGADEGRRLTHRTQELLVGARVTVLHVSRVILHYCLHLREESTGVSLDQVSECVQLGRVYEVLSGFEFQKHTLPQSFGTLEKMSFVHDNLLSEFSKLIHHTDVVKQKWVQSLDIEILLIRQVGDDFLRLQSDLPRFEVPVVYYSSWDEVEGLLVTFLAVIPSVVVARVYFCC